MRKLFCLFLLIPFLAYGEIKLSETDKIEHPLPILFMADTQIHNLLAPPHFFRKVFFDKLVETAIRPPLLDLFSPDSLKWTLFNYGEGNKVVFLGDALDISCKNEWQRFYSAMEINKVHSGWVMAFGNHDHTFYGNTNGSRSNERGLSKKWWAKSCQEGLNEKIPGRIKDVVMAKDDLVRSYLNVLFEENRIKPKDFPITNNSIKCDTPYLAKKPHVTEDDVLLQDCDFKSDDEESFLQRVHYALPLSDDIRFSYKSLMVQEINLGPNLKGILIDTGDFEDGPTFLIGALNNGKEKRLSKSLNSGNMGSLQKRQIDIIKKWMEGRESTYFLLMGHHPLEALSEKSLKLLGDLKKFHPRLGFVSAHTHTGYLKSDGVMPEINIGSMTDWNPGFVKIGPKFEENELSLEVNRIHFTEEMLNCSSRDDLTGQYTLYKKIKGGGMKLFDFTMNSITESLYNAFSSVGADFRSQNDLQHKAKCKLTDKECSQENFLLAKEAMIFNSKLEENPDFYLSRISFGACQSLWAAKEEYSIKKK